MRFRVRQLRVAALVHNHDTRDRNNLRLFPCNISYGWRSVKYEGSNLWNQLSNDLKLIASVNSFESKLKLTLATPEIKYNLIFNYSSSPCVFATVVLCTFGHHFVCICQSFFGLTSYLFIYLLLLFFIPQVVKIPGLKTKVNLPLLFF